MAFKSIKAYNEERYGGFFLLRNDRDYADVIFLYRNEEDALVNSTHYIKSPDYSGYVECTGRGCPACAKNIRVQDKLFIPVYNIKDDEIQFWDRSTRFGDQLVRDVFSKYPNPSEYVFRITRIGAAGSIDTKYDIMAVGKNSQMPYDYILSKFHVTFPEYYSTVCKCASSNELSNMLNSNSTNGNGYTASPTQDYVPVPRPAIDVPDNVPESLSLPDYDSIDSDSNLPFDLDGDEPSNDVTF